MEIRWKKSSRSEGVNNCVEVTPDALRDTKNPGTSLPVDLARLLAVVKSGQLEHRRDMAAIRVSRPVAGRRQRRPIEPIDAGGDDTTSVVAAARR